jgi:hypothetical protein
MAVTHETAVRNAICSAVATAVGAGGKLRIRDGTAATFQVTDSSNVVIFSGTCSLSGGGGDLILSLMTVTAAQPATVTAGTYTAPA